MTVAEAAKLLEVRPGTVYSLCRAGLIGHMRIGVGRGTIRLTVEDVERFKADARAKGAAPRPARVMVPRPAPMPSLDQPWTFRHIKIKGQGDIDASRERH